MNNPLLRNPQLEGGPFLWEGGPVGVVLVHGYTATTAEVRPLAEYLHRQGYSVAGPLLPGHGTAPDNLNRCRWQDWADAVVESYQQLTARCEHVFIGGESLGGLLALYTAGEPVAQKAAGVLAYAPALMVPRSRLWLGRLLAPFIAQTQKPRRPADALVDGRWQGYEVNPLRAAAQMYDLQREVLGRLARIQQPLLVVQGRLDLSIDVRGAEIIFRESGSSVKEMHWMEGSTHCVILDREWEQAAELTLRFMQRVVNQAQPV